MSELKKFEKLDDDQLDEITGGSILFYQVQPGDTLTDVAGQYNVSVEQLMRWNHIQDQNYIMIGQQLKIKF